MEDLNKEQESQDVMAKEVAVKEVIDFVKKWDDKNLEDFEVEDLYPNVIKALQSGHLVFDTNKKPVYKLRKPLTAEDADLSVTEIKFRTRIKPSELAEVTKGLNIAKQQIAYTNRCLSFITYQNLGIIDSLDKFDFKVIEQIATVFM